MTSSIGNVASVAARAGGTVVRQVRSVIDPSAARPAGAGQPASGWLAVTVFREPADIDAAALPAPWPSTSTGSRSASARLPAARAPSCRPGCATSPPAVPSIG